LSYSDNWTDDNDAPVCVDESPFPVWANWNASQRDLFVIDLDGNVALHQNVSMGLPDDLEYLLLDLLDPVAEPCQLGVVYVSEGYASAADEEDYIEVHNSGDTDCSLEGFQLDDSEDLEDLTFGNVIIPAGEYWIGHEGQDDGFASSLNPDGGIIFFADSLGTVLTVNLEPSQELDGIELSQSFDADGVGCHTNPSPGSENGDCITLNKDKISLLPNDITLHQNYPNPFNPITTINYDLSIDAMVTIAIYDMNGKVVRNLVSGHQRAGHKLVEWNGTNNYGMSVSAGVYLYRMQADGFVQTSKMVLLK